jgi:cytochrome c-type biogenesis protein CcmH/NrfG
LAIAVESGDPENYETSIVAWERFLKVAGKDAKARDLVASTEKHLTDLRSAKAAKP